MSHNPEYEKEYRMRPEVKQYQKEFHQKYKNTQKYKDYQKKYRQTEKCKERMKRYKQSPKYRQYEKEVYNRPEEKERKRVYRRNRYKNSPDYREYCKNYNKQYDYQQYYEKNKDKLLENLKRYNQSDKGKIKAIRQQAKRKRKYGFNILYENIIDEPIDWHHLNNDDVVAIPSDLHELFLSHDIEFHRECLKSIVEQLYPIQN